ncbi:hypothetical protein GY12_22240 [Micrococcus luteus]|nr:hypothetical protein GY12_22240 [Micrococcus luteus]
MPSTNASSRAVITPKGGSICTSNSGLSSASSGLAIASKDPGVRISGKTSRQTSRAPKPPNRVEP